jgi:hypothetical protein
MPYHRGGNMPFFLSETRIFSEDLNAVDEMIIRVYEIKEFELFQCVKDYLRIDGFSVRFKTPPAELVKKVPWNPSKSNEGYERMKNQVIA